MFPLKLASSSSDSSGSGRGRPKACFIIRLVNPMKLQGFLGPLTRTVAWDALTPQKGPNRGVEKGTFEGRHQGYQKYLPRPRTIHQLTAQQYCCQSCRPKAFEVLRKMLVNPRYYNSCVEQIGNCKRICTHVSHVVLHEPFVILIKSQSCTSPSSCTSP